MADKKKITLRDLHDLLDEQHTMTKRVTLFFATEGGLEIIIDKPEEKSNA